MLCAGAALWGKSGIPCDSQRPPALPKVGKKCPRRELNDVKGVVGREISHGVKSSLNYVRRLEEGIANLRFLTAGWGGGSVIAPYIFF